MLHIHSVSVSYGQRPVLEKVSLKIGRGEIVALIGPNGAGKTTLMRAVSGVIPLNSGQVLLDGKDAAGLPVRQRAGLLAVVPQARDLPADFSVRQAVLMGRTPYLGWLGQAGPADLERVAWALKRTRLEALAERCIGDLSGGEQQRVLLARAVAQDPSILLLDEPTSHLDLQHQSVLLNLVRELARENGLAVLMAVHDLNLAALYADRVALLVEGKLASEGAPSDVLTSGNLRQAYGVPVHVIAHPDYGTPLILPDGVGGDGAY